MAPVPASVVKLRAGWGPGRGAGTARIRPAEVRNADVPLRRTAAQRER